MVKVGDKLLLQQKQQHKLSTLYDCRPYTVIARRGPRIVLQRGDETPIMCNVSLVHMIPNETNSEEDDVDFGKVSTQVAVVKAENNGLDDDVSEVDN